MNTQTEPAVQPVFRQVENICDLLAEPNEVDAVGDSEVTGSRHGETSAGSVVNQYYRVISH